MRLGVISDLHANLPALEGVLDALTREVVDAYVCAGDLVGYGANPNECVQRIAALGAYCVAGNHDLIASGRLSPEGAGRLARESLAWTSAELGDAERTFLSGLPLATTVGPVVVAHGSLEDPRVYVTPARADDELERLGRTRPGATVLILGHTHHPLARGTRRGDLLAAPSGVAILGEGERVLLNPGSVGQARERRVLARYLVLDLAGRRADFRALPYDHRASRRALRARGLPPNSLHRDPRGWRARAGRVRRAARKRLDPVLQRASTD